MRLLSDVLLTLVVKAQLELLSIHPSAGPLHLEVIAGFEFGVGSTITCEKEINVIILITKDSLADPDPFRIRAFR